MWGCASGDKVKHFYTRQDSESFPACNPDAWMVRDISPGGNKKKCAECVKALKVVE